MTFTFTQENLEKAKLQLKKYPSDRKASAVKALLDLAQRQNEGSLSQEAIEYVATFLEMPFIRVHEVATFYTMFNLKPVGKFHVQVCGTTPCMLRGAGELLAHCEEKLGISCGDVTQDGLFGLCEVECVGACVNAPVVKINDDYYEDLNAETLDKVLEALKEGKEVKIGSKAGRHSSEPQKDPKDQEA